MRSHYGYWVRVLGNCTTQAMSAALASMDLTGAQGQIMGYITHRDSPPCARDIENEFQLSHPTVSGILSRLEQKDFIEFREDPADHRCKRIYVLDKGRQLDETMHQAIGDLEEKLVRDFTEEEKAQFAAFLTRAIDNLGGNPCKRKQKEDPKP